MNTRSIKTRALISVALLTTLLGCTPEPEATAPQDAQALVDSLVYVRANNGLCFAVTTTSRISSNLTIAQNQILTQVPCLQAGLRL